MSTVATQEDWKKVFCEEFDEVINGGMVLWESNHPWIYAKSELIPNVFATPNKKYLCVFDEGACYEYRLFRVEEAE